MATHGLEGAARRSPRVRRTWDVVLAIALLVVLVVLAVVLGFAGAFLVMASDSCTAATCRTGQLSAGVLIAMLGPAVVAVIAVASVVERLVRARLAFWPPIVGIAVAVLVWAGGAAIAFTSVPAS